MTLAVTPPKRAHAHLAALSTTLHQTDLALAVSKLDQHIGGLARSVRLTALWRLRVCTSVSSIASRMQGPACTHLWREARLLAS